MHATPRKRWMEVKGSKKLNPKDMAKYKE